MVGTRRVCLIQVRNTTVAVLVKTNDQCGKPKRTPTIALRVFLQRKEL